MTNRRKAAAVPVLGLVVALALAGCGTEDNAQASDGLAPGTIEVIVPFAAGGAADLMCRAMAGGLSEELDRNVVTLNRPGAGGVTGTTEVANADPDGLTMLCSANGVYLQTAIREVPFTFDDFVPVVSLGTQPQILVASNNSSIDSYEALGGADHRINYGVSGVGNLQHLLQALIYSDLGLDAQDIPFESGAEVTQALLGDQVELGLADASVVTPQIDAGNLRAVVALTDEPDRLDFLPEVATSDEVGLDLEASVLPVFGMTVPAGIDDGARQELVDGLAAALEREDVKQVLEASYMVPDSSGDETAWYERTRAAAEGAAQIFGAAGIDLGSR